MKLKGRRFDDVDIMRMNTTRELNSLSFEDFQLCFQKWQECLDKSISSAGDYFEGSN
jgi:ABC-type antimicrobial peptide transport system ATPase subunit